MPPALDIRPLTGDALSAALEDVARLRISVFRAYPYLYDGDMAYEARYLETFSKSDGALIVGAFDGSRLVGASTGAPMEGQMAEWSAPFRAAGRDLTEIFYCGESVLSPDYRGRGVGHAFFDAREEHARSLGRTWSCFCGVVRPEHHPARPAGHQPLDPFWRKRGYAPMPGMTAQFSWREVGQDVETEHDLQFWIRKL